MFKKILIANRGEVRAADHLCLRELGIRAVAVYSKRTRTRSTSGSPTRTIADWPGAQRRQLLNVRRSSARRKVPGPMRFIRVAVPLRESAYLAEGHGEACHIRSIGPGSAGDPSDGRANRRAHGA